MEDDPLSGRFARWLRNDVGIDEPRRIVRHDPDRILVSKFEAGFAARPHEAMAQLPEPFDDPTVRATYAEVAAPGPRITRVEAWHQSQRALVTVLAAQRSISTDQRSEIMAGIDSVAALLDAILWKTPLRSASFVLARSEEEAYRDALARMDAEPASSRASTGRSKGQRW